MKKELIKECSYCHKVFYANKPHFEKSVNCPALARMFEDFVKGNNVQPFEVWHTTISMDDYTVGFQYNPEQTALNFMRLVYQHI